MDAPGQPFTSTALRRCILEQSKRAHVGHIGPALSIADLVTALFSGPLRRPGKDHPERDRLVLSKGHAALALYSALHLEGTLSRDQLDSFCGDGAVLGVHPERSGERGIDFSTGSLGQGLSIGAGAALAARLDGSARRTFVILSDAECNEGSTWEAITFAAHHQLSSLVAILDLNGQQALGFTDDVLKMTPMAERWQAFGWRTHEVDGHDVALLAATLEGLDTRSGPPHVVVARTVAGKGVSFMERKIKWHYWPVSDEEYEQAMKELAAEP